jgi:hypothetical protein
MNNSSYLKKYQFYSNGRYALVDAHYRTIWFVLANELVAHAIRKIFLSKITLLVFDLTAFKNFDADTNTVDTDVCLDWQVGSTKNYLLAIHQLSLGPFNQTQTDYSHDSMLINQSAETLLTRAQQLELQDQIFLYLRIYQNMNTIAEGASIFSSNTRAKEKLLPQIDQIFLVELSIKDIENCLRRLAFDNIGQFPGECAKLLRVLGKSLYE